MAAAEVAARPLQDRPSRRRPFAQWVKNLTGMKSKNGGQHDNCKNDKKNNEKNGTPLIGSKHKKAHTMNGTHKNNPYPESGHHLQQQGHSPASSANGQMSYTTRESRPQRDDASLASLPTSTIQERGEHNNSNRSGAPTLATNPETVNSEAGHSKAATTTTHGGALSSTDGAGPDSTFSSPNQSQHSLTTTLTTIQSTSPGNVLQGASGHHSQQHNGHLSAGPVMFSHQYPVSPTHSTANTISAIPRHMNDQTPAAGNGLASDNASILTLASSSKRRRRSMDTDASVRAMAPSSVWGGSRESLPLSVLSGNPDGGPASASFYPTRPSMGGLASAERASVYSSQGISAPALASERNSYYSHKPTKDLADAKSLRSLTNIDARSMAGDARSLAGDARSLNNADNRSLGDVASLRNYESSMRSGAVGHDRNGSLSGSIGSPLASPMPRHTSNSGPLSRRSSDWRELDEHEEEQKMDEEARVESERRDADDRKDADERGPH